MGAEIDLEHGYVDARSPNGCAGRDITFDIVTVTGTENIMMAAVLAEGDDGAAQRRVRARGGGAGRRAHPDGGRHRRGRHPGDHHPRGRRVAAGCSTPIIPDRIETGTFMVAAALTGGHVAIVDCEPRHLEAVIDKLREAGADIRVEERSITVTGPRRIAGDRHQDPSLPRVPHRHAGAVHGADERRRRGRRHHRDHLREPLHARERAAAHGRGHPGVGQHGHGAGGRAPLRRDR